MFYVFLRPFSLSIAFKVDLRTFDFSLFFFFSISLFCPVFCQIFFFLFRPPPKSLIYSNEQKSQLKI